MAQLVETSEEDSFVVIASYLGELIDEGQGEGSKLVETAGSRFVDECKQLYFGEQYSELIGRFASQFDLVINKSTSDQDVDCCLSVTCHLVQRLQPQPALAAAQQLATALMSQPESKPEKRLQALVTLYNVLAMPEAKYAILLQILSFSKTANLADIILPVVRSNIDSWTKDLKLSAADERALYVASADTLHACTRKPKTAGKEAHRLLCKCLASYETASGAEAAGGAPVAAQVVTQFLRSQDGFQFDMADNPAVKYLASSTPEHVALHKMLTIYLTGTVQEYTAFIGSNPSLLPTIGVSADEALTKMRLLALMGMAHDATEVTFTDIQSALGLSADEVEALLVQALGKRLLEGRIDQLRGVVTISKCNSRTFGPAQWKGLEQQLGNWVKVVQHVRAVGEDEKTVLAKSVAELGLVSA